MRPRTLTPLAAAWLVAVASWSGAAQEPAVAPPAIETRETGLTVALPADQTADLEIVADGGSLPYRVLDRQPWEVAIFFDQLLSDPRVLRNAAVRLAERASALADLGPVQILLGGETVRSALPPSTDSQAIDDALAWLRVRESSTDGQATLRREFVAAAASGEVGDDELQDRLDDAMAGEAELIRLQREGLLLWATKERGARRRLLLLAGSGYDGDPAVFYRTALEAAGRRGLRVPEIGIRPTASELGQALAVSGWTVLAFAPAESGDAILSQPPQPPPSTVSTPDGRDVQRGVIGFDALKLGRKGAQAAAGGEAPTVRLEPLASLRPLSEATGGAVVTDTLQLGGELEELAWRSVLAVQVPITDRPLPVEVRRGSGGVTAPAWLGASAPAALSAARARFLAASGENSDGDLQIAALVTEGEPPRLALELSAAGGDEVLRPQLRLTIAEATEEGTTILDQRQLGAADVAAGRIDVPLPGALSAEAPIVVVVDELGSGRWGGVFAGFNAQTGFFEAGDGSTLLDLPEAAKVRLLAPQDALLVGRVRFAAVVSDSAVREVDFLLDGRQEAVRRAPPFEAELDLGQLPRPRRVEVVARREDGGELGRDVLLINTGNSDLSVTLTAPGQSVAAGGSVRASGDLTVEAEVAAPRGARVAGVSYYWLDQLVATLHAPPYRQRVQLPTPGARGFVRVVVTLADGAAVEDVLFVNSAGSSERVQVTLVELLAVVTDEAGRPVPDLDREDFTVKEEGEVKELAVFNSSGEMPLTVGLAVDSSASMFIKLPTVQLVAMNFLRGLMGARDRGFVVGFGTEPSLMAPTTGDLQRLVGGIAALRPDGFTSIWKGIVYSLVQLQGTPGKKALVVYSDGADEDPDFSFRTARRFARVVGVPIYVILSNNEIVRTQGRGLNIRGFLGRLRELVDDVGGRVYLTRVDADLEDVYAEIAEELRSQYVLGYYGEQDETGSWRNIDVEVARPGLEVRAARGRYP
jgi:Ca-activated chloride channel homolog